MPVLNESLSEVRTRGIPAGRLGGRSRDCARENPKVFRAGATGKRKGGQQTESVDIK